MKKYEIIPLGELCDFQYGTSLPEAKRLPGEVPVYGSNGIVGYHNQKVTTSETIIIGRKGSVGKIHYSETGCFPIDTTYYVSKTKRTCYLKWLYYTLIVLRLNELDKSSAVPGLNRNDAYECKIIFPPFALQKKIAAILEKANAAREKRRQANQLTEQFLQSAFLEMFGDPATNPKGWELFKLRTLGTLGRGKSKHRPRNAAELLGGLYPLIQTGDVANSSGYIKEYKQTYSELGLKQSKLWPKGTLCITIAANIAKTGILTFDACFPDSIVGFIPNCRTNTEFIQQWFSFVQKHLEDTAPMSAQKNINLEILKNLKVTSPPFDLQQIFAALVDKVETLRTWQRQSDRELENLFNSLMQRAFRGELVPQDPNDEPASFLLEKIRAGKLKHVPNKRENVRIRKPERKEV